MGARFSAPIQTGPGAHPASCTMGTGSLPGVKSGQGVTLTPHPLLVPWSRMSRAIPLLPYESYGLYRASVPVQGCAVPFLPYISDPGQKKKRAVVSPWRKPLPRSTKNSAVTNNVPIRIHKLFAHVQRQFTKGHERIFFNSHS